MGWTLHSWMAWSHLCTRTAALDHACALERADLQFLASVYPRLPDTLKNTTACAAPSPDDFAQKIKTLAARTDLVDVVILLSALPEGSPEAGASEDHASGTPALILRLHFLAPTWTSAFRFMEGLSEAWGCALTPMTLKLSPLARHQQGRAWRALSGVYTARLSIAG